MQYFLEPIVCCLWFAQKIPLRTGDSRGPHEVQLALSLDSLGDDFKTHGFRHLDQSAHNPLAAILCQALHEASVNFQNINRIFQQSLQVGHPNAEII